MQNLKFPKSGRLSGNKNIQALFKSGKRIYEPPLQMVYFIRSETAAADETTRILVSVPKKNYRKAHDRNRLKRQMREAWRHSRHLLIKKKPETASENMTKALHIAFIYQSPEKQPWAVILSAMERALMILARKL